eukprot:SAG22_NODE_206_length_15281_cov_6.078975_2_plen_62_part_00
MNSWALSLSLMKLTNDHDERHAGVHATVQQYKNLLTLPVDLQVDLLYTIRLVVSVRICMPA